MARKKKRSLPAGGFLQAVALDEKKVPEERAYPFSIPAIRELGTLELHPKVTFLVGENGSGKSTLIEAIAVAAGFNAEGGTKNFNFATRRSESRLHEALDLWRGAKKERDGFFLRAESFFNVATEIEKLGVGESYGGRSLHEQSHGESFMALVRNRFGGEGLYILDEPEAALSPSRQLVLLAHIDRLVRDAASQFVIATHSPILMGYPDATIYLLDSGGIRAIPYEETEHFQVTRNFLNRRQTFLDVLLAEDEAED